jgi:hypothetical protein
MAKTNREIIDDEITKVDNERVAFEADAIEAGILRLEILGELIGRKAALEEIRPQVRDAEVAPR